MSLTTDTEIIRLRAALAAERAAHGLDKLSLDTAWEYLTAERKLGDELAARLQLRHDDERLPICPGNCEDVNLLARHRSMRA